jgi:predicted dinucleotide-binding enzyme
MNIGIIGAGTIGSAIARAFAQAGIAATLSNRRGPASLQPLVADIGPPIRAGTVQEAAAADIVIVAVNWGHLESVLKDLGPWDGRIVIDANNPVVNHDFRGVDLQGRSSSEVVADWVPGANLIKTFNHLKPDWIIDAPKQRGGRTVMFIAGENAAAKRPVLQLLDRIGFRGIDLGDLAHGGRLFQFPGGPFPALHLVQVT